MRDVIGVNIQQSELAWHSRYSVTVEAHPLDKIFQRVYEQIPEALFPEKGETNESMVDKIVEQKYLDVLCNWFRGKSGKSLNEDVSSMQPIRRTTGMVKKGAHLFYSKLDTTRERGES